VGVGTLLAGVVMFCITLVLVAIPGVQDLVLEGDLGASPLLTAAMAVAVAVVFTRRAHRPPNGDTVAAPFMLALLFGEVVLLVPTDGIQSVQPLLGSTAGLYACTLALMEWVVDLRSRFVQTGEEMYAARVQRQLEELQQAEQAARRRSQVHDARSTILAARFAAVALQKDTGELPPERRRALAEALAEEIGRLGELVQPEPEARPPARFRLAAAVAGPVELMRHGGQQIDVTADGDPWVHGRPSEVGQILQGLLDNARSYAGGTPVEVAIGSDAASATVRVSDCGQGVPVEEADAVFEAGVRGSTSRGTDGSGLGLANARRLAREMGGDLRLLPSSTGAVFELRLPAAPAPAADEIAAGGADD
jgi:signal transduction histidine kinase